MHYNNIVVDQLRRIYSSNNELIQMICKQLYMSKSTAYKKLSGSIQFSMEELVILAKYNNFSLDNIFDIFSDKVKFNFPHFESQIKVGGDFIEPIANDLANLKNAINPFVYYTSSEIPIFHYFRYDALSIFKFFIYEGTTWNTNNQKLRKFDPSELLASKSTITILKNMVANYYSINCEEYWTNTAFDKTISQIKYFLYAKLTDKEFALLLIENLWDLINNIERMARNGSKNLKYRDLKHKGKINILQNEIIHTGTTIYAKSENFNAIYMTYDHPNYLRSLDKKLISHTESYFKKLASKSYKITSGNDKNFYAFFNTIKMKIERAKKEIKSI